MRRLKLVPVLVVIVLLLQALSLAGASSITRPNERALRPDSFQVPGVGDWKAKPVDPVSIVVLSSDHDFPTLLVASLKCQRTSFEQALAGEFDALLMSKRELSRLSKSNLGKEHIREWLSKGKVLLVMDASTREMRESLHIEMPVMGVTTTRYLVGAVVQLSNGVFASGGVLLLKGQDYSLQEKSQDIRAYTAYILSVKEKAGGATGQSSNWRLEGMLSHYLDMCPFGKYGETAYAKRVTNDDSPAYDFWNMEIVQQAISGYSACDTSFQISKLRTRADVGVYWDQLLYRYDPTTTNAKPGGYVIDHSDFSAQQADWEFVYRHGSNSAKYTSFSKPSISVRTAEGHRLKLHRSIETCWRRHWWEGEYRLSDDWDMHF